MVPVIAWYLHRTRRGLEIRIVGENPRAGDMRGLHVSALRYAAVVFGGMMAGLGGAFLTLDSAGLFVPQISGGRGFIAFALVIVGNWSAGRILLGALFFGLIDSLQLQLQATGADVPHQLLLALPYLMTIVVLVVSRARSNSPLALGRPYTRELVVTGATGGPAGGGPFDGVEVVVDRDAADADGVGDGLHRAAQQEGALAR